MKARLIDANALMKAMYHRAFETDGDTMWQSGCWVRYRAIEEVVKAQPTIELKPEREPGRWVILKDEYGDIVEAVCSNCHSNGRYEWPYCPHCGKPMVVGETETEGKQDGRKNQTND